MIAAERKRAGAKTTIYFIQVVGGGPIKIGTAKNVLRRLETLRTACPYRLEGLAVMADCQLADEWALHERFRSARLRGEWFSPSPEILRFIREEAVSWDEFLAGGKARGDGREVITARLHPELLSRLRDAAIADRRSLSEMVEFAVEQMLVRRDQLKRKGKK